MTRQHYLFLFLLGIPFYSLIAQSDSLIIQPELESDIIEDFIQSTDEDDEFDYNTAFEDLELYLTNPLNLNLAFEADLQSLGLLSDFQIIDFLEYRQRAGDLLSLYELQAIPSFDLATIQKILPYVGLESSTYDYNMPISQMLYEGKNEVFFRWSRILETQKGYLPLEEGARGSRYLGDPNRLYMRFKHSYSNRMSYGITAEKDRGEEFFTGSNPQGFDFYSAHFYLRDYNQTLKSLAIGDYSVSLGQGLILFNGFATGKSASVIKLKRSGRTIRPYTSVNEADFMRGAATTLGLGEHLEVSVFGSYTRRDGNLVIDTTQQDAEEAALTSLDIDGFHRTLSEIEDENALQLFTAGGSVKYNHRTLKVALNALYNKLDKPLERTFQPYNQFFFSGDQLLNVSLDYSYLYRNFNFFGETAISDNGGLATINGILVGLDRRIDLAILYRNFAKDYQALNANPFAETSGGRNETGIYMGLEIRPRANWTISAYYDLWKHPWLRFQADAPSNGHEFRGRITYYKKRDFTAYIQVRDEHKQINAPGNTEAINYLVDSRLFQARLHMAKKISPIVELRSRVELGFFENDIEGRFKGYAVMQDILFKPKEFPLSITTRFALFDTEDFAIRFYSYENDLLYTFSIPAYFYKGTRFYINLRYRNPNLPNLTLECRYARTYLSDRDTFGSALEEINGPTRTEMKAQVRYQF